MENRRRGERNSAEKKGEPKGSRKKNNNTMGWVKLFACIAVIIAAISVIVSGFVTYFSGDKSVAKEGVTVLGHNVSSMSESEIANMLDELSLAGDFSFTYIIEGTDTKLTIGAEDIDLVLDTKVTAQNAVYKGRKNILDAFSFLFGNKTAEPSFSFNHVKFSAACDNFSQQAGGTLKQHYFETDGTNVVVYPGHSGTGVDTNEMLSLLEGSFKNLGGSANVKIVTTSPSDVNIDELYAFTLKDPVDAHYEVKDQKELIISPSENGTELDRDQAKKLLSGFGENSEPVSIPLILTPAKVDSSSINENPFTDVLGSFKTKYNVANTSRSANVELAAKYANGTILLPGDEFSYNKAVGQRTSERGFKPASVYEGSRSVDGLGGGICQVSTTIYSAVLYTDLKVTERHEHSLEVHYGTLGMDATVSYGSLDFRFVNTTNYPIKVSVTAKGGVVEAKILGIDEHPETKYEITTERVSYTPFELTTIVDDTLSPGQKVEDCEGFNGAVINTYKTTYVNGSKTGTEFLHKSVYRMVNRIVRVAKAQEPAPPEENVPANAATGSDVVISGDDSTAKDIIDSLEIPDGI